MTVVVQDLIELAERCEKATDGDRELDLAIQRALSWHPWRWADSRTFEPQTVITWDQYGTGAPGNPVCTLDEFTGSIDAAVMLVPETHWWEIVQTCAPDSAMRNFGSRNGMFTSEVGQYGGDRGQASNDRPALALCAASLRARASLKGAG